MHLSEADEQSAGFRFRCLNLAVDYIKYRPDAGEPIALAQAFEGYCLNSLPDIASGALAVAASIADKAEPLVRDQLAHRRGGPFVPEQVQRPT